MPKTIDHQVAGRIFWDSYGLHSRNSGIHRYADCFARELIKIGISPRIIQKEVDNIDIASADRISITKSKMPAVLANSKVFWPVRVQTRLEHLLMLENRQKDAVILHGLSNINLARRHALFGNIKKVITVHDLIPLLLPQSVSSAYYLQFKFLLPRVMAAADSIICVSKWTARGVMELFPNFSNKVVVIPNGFSSFDKLQTFNMPPLSTGSKLKLISVGRFEPYKEFNVLKEILFKRGNDISITLVTDRNGQNWARREAAALMSTGALQVLSNVDDGTLKALYRNSHAMVHPSRFEGFCLPAAECLSSGTPVIYCSGSGIDEIVGSTVGVPMKAKSSVYDWISAIEFAANLKYQQKFIRDLADHIDNAPKWPDSGILLKKVYERLLA